MQDRVDHREILARREAARAVTERYLAILEAQIIVRAARMTMSRHAKSRRFARISRHWNRAKVRTYQDNLAALRFARRAEIETLTRELLCQPAATRLSLAADGGRHPAGAMTVRVDTAARQADNIDVYIERVRSGRKAVGRRQGDWP
ncbi:MAG: hypothetical protein WDN69_27465 [Aliidongia sp.]